MREKRPTRRWPAIVALVFAMGMALPAGAAGGRRMPGHARYAARGAAAVKAAGAERDPFLPLVNQKANDLPMDLPPGKAGLIIGRLRLEGLVHAPSGMLAVVSTPHGRVFFLRAGDRLYDGAVAMVGRESATFHEVTRDAYGRPLTRTVTLRLHSSKGE
jgi:hypothetical protein